MSKATLSKKYPRMFGRARILTLSADEVAWLFEVERTTVQQWVKYGTLTPCIDDGQECRFLRQDVADLLEAFGA